MKNMMMETAQVTYMWIVKRITKYRMELKKDQQIASGPMKLLQH